MKTLTIFTTTYNRAYLLPQLYKSLCEQTADDFIWLIIDDGSSDNTKELVESWIKNKRIEINYFYKENGGMHTGHNMAYKLIKTELNMCIDSDDYLLTNSVEIILNKWKVNKDSKYAGILGLDVYKDGSLVSNKRFPKDLKAGRYFELKGKYNLVGDIKFIYRTDVIIKYPDYPTFKNEKFTPLGYKYMLIDQDYEMIFLNEPVCVVEYMNDGSTKNIIRQYFKNPNGFNFERRIRMQYSYSFKEKIKNAAHYVSTSIILKDRQFLNKTPKPLLTIAAIPLGIIIYFYIKYKNDRAK